MFDKCVQLVILGCSKIKDSRHSKPPLETQRRNELVREMRRWKSEFGLVQALILKESAESNENDRDTGRMDITFFYSASESEYITFECKRFLSRSLTSSYFQAQYNGEGIQRFVDGRYSAEMPMAGMIAFIETGDYEKARRLFLNELPKTVPAGLPVRECSEERRHQYVFQTAHLRKNNKYISLTHIMMDFTQHR